MPLILIGGLAAALIAAQTEQGLAGATHVPPDAEILSLLAPVDVRTQTAELHELVRRERRDDAWARDVESMVRGRYSEIPHMNDTGEVRVTCAASLCEVAQILPGPDQANQQDQNALDLALQSDALRSDLAKLGLTYQSSSFKDDGTKRKQTLFLAYWSRWQQPKPDALFDGKLGEDARGERRFYKQVRDETRDPAWAARMEKGLTALLQSQPSLSQGNHRIRVNCAATLCEISAMTAPRAPQPQIDAFYRDLQTWTYSTGIEKLGLKDAMIQFGDLPDKSRNVYIAYYRRNGA